MGGFVIAQQYPHPPQKVWRALTDPELVPRWTSSGQGGTPVGFAPVVGTHFKYVAKPMPGWDGIVVCVVLAVEAPGLLQFSWANDAKEKPTTVTVRLEAHDGGTRLTWEHGGFEGIGGFFMSKLLGSVRRKMLRTGFPALLDAI